MSLNKTAATIKVGGQETLSVTVAKVPADAAEPTVAKTWSSSNTSVATVDNSGVVTGVGKGTAEITVTCTPNGDASKAKTATCRVAVEANLGDIRITPTGPFTMEQNDQLRLIATAQPDSEKINWSVAKTEPEGASVVDVQGDSTGRSAVIYSQDPGRATITAVIGEEGGTQKKTSVDVEVSGLILEYSTA